MSQFSGRRLRQLRVAAGIPRERLALEIGRSIFSVLDYEAGRTDPPAPVISRLADVLGVAPGDLFDTEAVAS
jgi:transcriptional regulator with XRE-family HTH domain